MSNADDVRVIGPMHERYDEVLTPEALNSGARVELADHEDANTPLWENTI